MSTQWRSNPVHLSPPPPKEILPWLIDAYILTQTLKKITPNVTLTLVSQQFDRIDQEEAEALNLTTPDTAWVRKIFLCCDDRPVSYSRVIVPHKTYLAYQNKFDSVQKNFIGEFMLYDNPEVRREAFEYCQMPQSSLLVKELSAHDAQITLKPIWARRSCFWINEYPLLITDSFLPDMPNYPDKTHTMKPELI